MTTKLQNLFIFLGIIILAGLGYYLVVLNTDSKLNNDTVNNKVALETSEFLQKLISLQEIKLDGGIFEDARFVTLVDNSEPVIPPPKGRANPFVPTY